MEKHVSGQDPETKLDKVFLLFFTGLFTTYAIGLFIIIFILLITNDILEWHQHFIWITATTIMSRMSYWYILQSKKNTFQRLINNKYIYNMFKFKKIQRNI